MTVPAPNLHARSPKYCRRERTLCDVSLRANPTLTVSRRGSISPECICNTAPTFVPLRNFCPLAYSLLSSPDTSFQNAVVVLDLNRRAAPIVSSICYYLAFHVDTP